MNEDGKIRTAHPSFHIERFVIQSEGMGRCTDWICKATLCQPTISQSLKQAAAAHSARTTPVANESWDRRDIRKPPTDPIPARFSGLPFLSSVLQRRASTPSFNAEQLSQISSLPRNQRLVMPDIVDNFRWQTTRSNITWNRKKLWTPAIPS